MLRRSGSVLLSVLFLMTVLLLFGFLVSGLSTADLTFAGGFRAGVVDEMLARSAVQQFLREAQEKPDADWAARFQSPVFPDGGRRLPGTVKITFDRRVSRYFSVDNIQSDQPAFGWNDSGRPTVPPFGVSLVMTVQSGSRTSHFEAILQRRWPYVLTNSAGILLASQQQNVGPATSVYAPCVVQGDILKLESEKVGRNVLHTTKDNADNILNRRYGMPSACLVAVGVAADTLFPASNFKPSSLQGNVRLCGHPAETRPVQLFRPNAWSGRATTGQKSPELDKILAIPDCSDYTPLETVYPLKAGEVLEMRADVQGKLLKTKLATSNYFYSTQGITVNCTQSKDFMINGSFGNRLPPSYVPPSDWPGVPPAIGKGGVELNNCRLFVNGDMVFSQLASTGDGDAQTTPGLRGNNATLIVNGDLVLDDGVLDAGEQGLVIWCRNLYLEARGDFRGLFLVEKAAFLMSNVFSNQPTMLNFRGALVCGSGKTDVWVGDTLQGSVDSLHLLACNLQYDAHYLKSIHRYGPMMQLDMRRLP